MSPSGHVEPTTLAEFQGLDPPFVARSKYFTLVFQGDKFWSTTEKKASSPGARLLHSQSKLEAQRGEFG